MPSTKMRNKIKQIGQRHTKWAQNWKLRAREKEAESLNKKIRRQRKKVEAEKRLADQSINPEKEAHRIEQDILDFLVLASLLVCKILIWNVLFLSPFQDLYL